MLSVPGWYLGSRCQTEAGRLQALLSYRKCVGLQNFPPSAVATHRGHRRGVEEFGEHGKEEELIQTNQPLPSAGGKAIPAHTPNTGTYHRILDSVNQINDVGATAEILQNLNLAFYLLFLHWLK